jgi:hypothetical protein
MSDCTALDSSAALPAEPIVAGWASAIIERGRRVGPVPRFGSPEWEALPSSDPRFVASVALAAECWSDHCSTRRISQQLADELIASQQLDNARRDAVFTDAAGRVRHLASVPTEDTIRARRMAS